MRRPALPPTLPSGLLAGLITGTLMSCASGAIYSDITTPLDINFTNTPVVTAPAGSAESDTKSFRYYIRVDWDSNAIGEIMRQSGLEEVYYADLHTTSILGIWRQTYVMVYGR